MATDGDAIIQNLERPGPARLAQARRVELLARHGGEHVGELPAAEATL